MPDSPALRGRDIVCVGFADWDTELWTNQHHLMSRLARDEPRAVRRVARACASRSSRGATSRGSPAGCGAGSHPPRDVDGLHVLSPLVVPLHRSRLVRALNARLLPWLVRRAARRLGLQRADPVGVRAAGRGADRRAAPVAGRLPLRR